MSNLSEHDSGPAREGGDLRGRAIRGGAISMVSQVVKLVIQIGTTAVLARLLGPSEFGLVAMVTPFVTFIQLLQDAGLQWVTLQRQDITKEQVGSLFWVNVAFAGVLTLVLIVCAPLVAAFFDDDRLTLVTVAFALLLVPAATSVQHRALLQRAMNFRTLMAIDITMQVVGAGVAIAMALAGYGYWALVAHAGTLTLSQIPLLWMVLPWRPGPPRGFAAARHLLRAGGEITGYNLMNFVARNIDNILIGKVWGDAALGLYGRAFNLMMTPIWQINAPLGNVAVPLLSRLADQPARYRNAFRHVLEKLLLVTTPGIVVMVAASEPVVTVLFGTQWLAAAPILAALGVAAVVQPLNYSANWLFISQGRSADLFRWGFVSAPLQIAGIVAGLPWGGVGVAIGFATVNVLAVTPLLWHRAGSPLFTTRDAVRTVAPFALAAAVSGGGLILAGELVATMHPLAALVLAIGWSYSIQLAVLVVIPAYRRVVREVYEMVTSALRGVLRPAKP